MTINIIKSIWKKNEVQFFTFLLLVYFILKFPFLLSVKCSSSNEGFYFIFGYHFFLDFFQRFTGNFVFIFIYALIVNIFGFNSYSILFAHMLQFLTFYLVSILIFIVLRILNINFKFSILGVLICALMIFFPIGGWGEILEFNALNALEAEYFVSLFSLISIILFIKSLKHNDKKVIFFSSLFAVLSMFCKANGAIIYITYMVWLITEFIFNQEQFFEKKNILLSFFLLLFTKLLLISTFLILVSGSLNSFLENYFLVGSYSVNFASSTQNLFTFLYKFLIRNTYSFKGLCNLFIFLFSYISIVITVMDYFFSKGRNENTKFWFLLSVWTIGNSFAVLAPGEYGAYYYLILFPGICIFFAKFTHDLFKIKLIEKLSTVKYLFILIVFIFICIRLIFTVPPYIKNYSETLNSMCFFQKQSFDDNPSFTNNIYRSSELKLSDLINSFSKDKLDTIFVFNFVEKHYSLSPPIYVYIKRPPPTTILADHLQYKNILEKRIKFIKSDFNKNPPTILVLPENVYFPLSGLPAFDELTNWFREFILNKYRLVGTIKYSPIEEIRDNYLIYRLIE